MGGKSINRENPRVQIGLIGLPCLMMGLDTIYDDKTLVYFQALSSIA